MRAKLKQDLMETWNEIEEVITSFKELSDAELITCREPLQQSLEKALHWLDKYVDEEDVIEKLL